MSVNKVILIGNVGKDPEVRHIDSGVAVANFPLATSESYTAKNGDRITTTEWHNIVAWRGLAEVVEKYVKKGRQLYIEGRIKTRNYEDKDGNKKYVTEIYADVLQLLAEPAGTQKSQVAPPQDRGGYNGSGFSPADTPDILNSPGDEDLPF
jgi:single-strand DNA-binding protein